MTAVTGAATATAAAATPGGTPVRSRAKPSKAKSPMRFAFEQQANVMRAVVLRDVRTRFFDHGLGFLLVPVFPAIHLAILLTISKLIGRYAPYGDSLLIFFATGLLPTLTFMYVSRFMALSLLMNRPMMAFPAVRMMDIVLARAFLEIIGSVLCVLLVFGVMLALGEDPFPIDPYNAIYAYLAVVLLAIGIGLLVSVMSAVGHVFAWIYTLLLVIIYVMSGSLFVIGTLPEQLAQVLAYNPVLHATEWMRTAYFGGYPDQYLSKSYLLGWGLGSVFLGLFLERYCRGYLLISR